MSANPVLVNPSACLPPGAPFERHFTVKELAQMWGFSPRTVRRILAQEDGLIRREHPETQHKRSYTVLRVPESIVRRVHRKLTQN